MPEKKDWIAMLTFIVLISTTLGTTIYNYSTVNSKVESISIEIEKRAKKIDQLNAVSEEVIRLQGNVSSNTRLLEISTSKLDSLKDTTNDMKQKAATLSVIVESLDGTLTKVNDTLERINNTVIIVNSELKTIKKDVEELKEESQNNDRK